MAIHAFPRIKYRFVGSLLEMRIALGCLVVRVSEQVLDLVERDSCLDEPGGARMAHGVRRVMRYKPPLTGNVEVVGVAQGKPPRVPAPVPSFNGRPARPLVRTPNEMIFKVVGSLQGR